MTETRNPVVRVHPDKKPKVVEVWKGSTLTFVNECDEYPDFEVEIKRADSPEIKGEPKGTTQKPIQFLVPNEEKLVHYSLVFKGKNGKEPRKVDGQFKMAKEPPPG